MGGVSGKEQSPVQTRLRSVLVRLFDPGPGQDIDFHRWSERDHFKAGCLAGSDDLAGRYIATRSLKDERMPEQESSFRDVRDGSYLMLDWLFEGQGISAGGGAVKHFRQLLENDRIQSEGQPVHVGLYQEQCLIILDSGDLSAEANPGHPYGGAGMTLLQAPNDDTRADLLTALEERILPETLKEAEAELCAVMTPMPLPADVLTEAERSNSLGRRVLLLSFFLNAPFGSMRDWSEQLVDRLRAERLGRLEIAAPFIPVEPGMERGADELR